MGVGQIKSARLLAKSPPLPAAHISDGSGGGSGGCSGCGRAASTGFEALLRGLHAAERCVSYRMVAAQGNKPHDQQAPANGVLVCGFHTRLLLPILYGIYCNKGGRGGIIYIAQ